MKLCCKCKILKDRDGFSPDVRHKDGLMSRCKECRARDGREQRALQPKKSKQSEEVKKRHRRDWAREWRKDNPEKVKEANRRWYQKNREKYCEQLRNKRKTDLKYRLASSFRTLIHRGLKRKTGRVNIWKMLGYTAGDLIAHLKKQFTDGMSWENYGEWQIDHIIPRSSFQYRSYKDAEFKMCWRLENLRPLWRTDNCRRNKKLKAA